MIFIFWNFYMKKMWFTLFEMVIIVVILAILSTTIIPKIWRDRDMANDTARMTDIRAIATALISYKSDHLLYPDVINASELSSLLSSHYWMDRIPRDPVSYESYSYKMLEWGKHFVLCATLSNGSTAGNSKKDYAFLPQEEIDMTYKQIISKFGNTWPYFCFAR